MNMGFPFPIAVVGLIGPSLFCSTVTKLLVAIVNLL